MPRTARTVVIGAPHHITQRGNRGIPVFDSDADRKSYLGELKKNKDRFGLKIWAYCLMDNHVHYIAVPEKADSLALCFKNLHMMHAQRINRRHKQRGHLWQGRFFSSVLDEPYLWEAVRYIERNPVRAGIVKKAEDYPWSSAKAHCRRSDDLVLSSDFPPKGDVRNWRIWLRKQEDLKRIEKLRASTRTGTPCGEKDFVKRVETALGRSFETGPVGRPRKEK